MFRPTPLRLFARSAVRLSGPTPAPGAYRQHVQRQKASGLSAASLGLVALLGWSAVVFGVAGRKEPKGELHELDRLEKRDWEGGGGPGRRWVGGWWFVSWAFAVGKALHTIGSKTLELHSHQHPTSHPPTPITEEILNRFTF